ncbi:MAG: DUF2723 domain-containing protein, partial [Gemmatimonadetes bacterium]|nr:DUF2723 domain-containing protein [Gemmatimonadota bacterium]
MIVRSTRTRPRGEVHMEESGGGPEGLTDARAPEVERSDGLGPDDGGSGAAGVASSAPGFVPAYGSAVLAGLCAWLLYVVTLAPSTAFWDTSEYIATAHIVGIPHPPGNPLFVLVTKVWTLLLAP